LAAGSELKRELPMQVDRYLTSNLESGIMANEELLRVGKKVYEDLAMGKVAQHLKHYSRSEILL
jgi:hypothetical protein